MNMTAYSRPAPACVNVEFAGELDLATNHQTREALRGALGLATTAIEVDLDQVRLLDCSTLAIILTAQYDAAQCGVELTVTNPHGLVRRVLQLTDTLALLTGHPTAPDPGSPRTDAKRPARPPHFRRPPPLRHPEGAGRGRLDDV